MTEEKFVRLNVAFKMPQEVSEAAIKLSKEVAEKEDTYFDLDGVDFIPHATIYSPEYPEKNLEKVIKEVEKISKDFSSVELVFKYMRSDRAFSGYIVVSFKNSDEVKNIHERIVQELNPLREGNVREKDKTDSGLGMENVEKYGYPMVMDLYDLHVTITRLKSDNNVEKIIDELEWKIKNSQLIQ